MNEWIEKAWALLLPEPKSDKDYFHLGKWMIYKRLVLILLLLSFSGAAVGYWYIKTHPAPPVIPVFHYLDDKLKKYTGEAILIEDNGDVVYRGQIVSGLAAGQGRQFDPPDETLVYEGGFLDNRYSGQGKLYEKAQLKYEGGFLNGRFDGKGALYGQDGKLNYTGGFLEGEYSGSGTLYQGEKVIYKGAFLNGLYDGEGILYFENASVLYEGGFARGEYNGEGVKRLQDGTIVYEGSFKDGLYHGKGALYALDGIRLRFEGDFINGIPSRTGNLFNTRGQLLYSGNVYQGQVDYLSLIGLPFSQVQEKVKETPVIYYGNGFVAFLYQELEFAVLSRYDYPSAGAIGQDIEETGEVLQQPLQADESLFAKPEDNLVADTLLVSGVRFWDQIPKENSIEIKEKEVLGFDAYIESKIAKLYGGGVIDPPKADETVRGSRLYQIEGLPETVKVEAEGVEWEQIRCFYRTDDSSKTVPAVIYCIKGKKGG